MRSVLIMTASLLCINSAVVAQPATTRPGHEIGAGDSMPYSANASNITTADTRTDIAPTLPAPSIGTNASTRDYLRAARASLVAGQTGETQQSLEMAESRALDRSVPVGSTRAPDSGRLVTMIREARQALGAGDRQHAIQIIDEALSS